MRNEQGFVIDKFKHRTVLNCEGAPKKEVLADNIGRLDFENNKNRVGGTKKMICEVCKKDVTEPVSNKIDFPMTCCQCGNKGTVPFRPKEGTENTLKCRECFIQGRA